MRGRDKCERTGKNIYVSRRQAEGVRRGFYFSRHFKEQATMLNVFQCSFCNGWHMGHAAPSAKVGQ